MILKIEESKYYGHQGKIKGLFKQTYRKVPKLTWMEKVELNGVIVDGWFSLDKKEYLLKLEMEGNFKRFTGNSERMFTFLKNHGAIEVDGEESGLHIDYKDNKGFISNEELDRIHIIGWSHYRTEELLKNVPDNFIKWSEPKVNNVIEKKIVRRIIRKFLK